MNNVGMNLAHRNQRPGRASGYGAGGQQNLFSIAFHAGAEIVLGEAQVQRSAAVAGGEAAGTRGESVDQPWNTF